MKRYLFCLAFGFIFGVVAAVWVGQKINDKKPEVALSGPPPAGVPADASLGVVGTSPKLVLKQTAKSGQKQLVGTRRDPGPVRKETPSVPHVADPTDTASFPIMCLDWQDSEGRFYFHQEARQLSIEQHFSLDFKLVDRESHVDVTATLLELSPRTGEVINSVPFDTRSLTTWRPLPRPDPKWILSAGASVGSDGIHPYIYGQRNFGRFLYAGVLATDETAIAVAGVTVSF